MLMWNDAANYAGIRVELGGEEGGEEIEMNWKISSFLPEIVRENFKTLIAGYLGSVSEAVKEMHAKLKSRGPSQTPESPKAKDESAGRLIVVAAFCFDASKIVSRLARNVYLKGL